MEGALVDPGGDLDKLLKIVKKEKVTIKRILLTHGHLDHVGAAMQASEKLGIEIYGPDKEEQFWFDKLPMQAQMFGSGSINAFLPHHWLKEGDVVSLGNLQFEVLFCPGHTPGHIVFFEPKSRVVFVGDVLFAGSIGRTDFPKGNHAQLISSIKDNLFSLGDDVKVMPGHGPTTTIGHERKTNPHLV
jgi:glyoxylase-like metal-dependent hydrolase (beta-lactamase superfamily II)